MIDNPVYINGVKDEDGWMSERMCKWLYEMAATMQTIVEIGSWKGRSTHALCSGCRGTVTVIDHFLGSPGDGLVLTDDERREDRVYNAFLKNMEEFKNLVINRTDSITAAAQYEDRSFDMVFIDAEHIYESVKKDLAAWLPKAKKLICGHDYFDRFPGVVRAVDEKFGSVECHDVIWFKWLDGE